MKLESAHITNFKLLEDVSLQFSSDLARPLTVIRAENGSGKTSILYALRWAMYGENGIPAANAANVDSPSCGQASTGSGPHRVYDLRPLFRSRSTVSPHSDL